MFALALISLCGAFRGVAAQAPLTDAQLPEFREDLKDNFISNQGGAGTSGGGAIHTAPT